MEILQYGIIKEFDNNTVLWFEPITEHIDGFVIREKDTDKIISIYAGCDETDKKQEENKIK